MNNNECATVIAIE